MGGQCRGACRSRLCGSLACRRIRRLCRRPEDISSARLWRLHRPGLRRLRLRLRRNRGRWLRDLRFRRGRRHIRRQRRRLLRGRFRDRRLGFRRRTLRRREWSLFRGSGVRWCGWRLRGIRLRKLQRDHNFRQRTRRRGPLQNDKRSEQHGGVHEHRGQQRTRPSSAASSERRQAQPCEGPFRQPSLPTSPLASKERRGKS